MLSELNYTSNQFHFSNSICSDSIFTQRPSDYILASYVVLPAESIKTIFHSK